MLSIFQLKKKGKTSAPCVKKDHPKEGFWRFVGDGVGGVRPPPQGSPEAVPAAWLVWASLLLDPVCHLLGPEVRQDDTALAPGSLSPRTGLISPPHQLRPVFSALLSSLGADSPRLLCSVFSPPLSLSLLTPNLAAAVGGRGDANSSRRECELEKPR